MTSHRKDESFDTARESGNKLTYIIWAYSFNEYIGGIIALHSLCDRLNKRGEKAVLWPHNKPFARPITPRAMVRWARYVRRSITSTKFKIHPSLKTPIGRYRDLQDNAVVLYPEIVDGNPLQAKNVIRWFLHKPGFHTGSVNYGINELYFFYQHAFNDAALNPDADNLLRVGWVRSDVYQKRNYGERHGSCYAIRKGKGRKIVHDLSDSVCIDKLSHEEIASLFNRKKFFYSYDLYTMFITYAAVCGCIPIVMPPEGMSRETWKPMERRFGVAFGPEQAEIDWAIGTRDQLLASLEERNRNEDTMVSTFVSKCESFFLNRSERQVRLVPPTEPAEKGAR